MPEKTCFCLGFQRYFQIFNDIFQIQVFSIEFLGRISKEWWKKSRGEFAENFMKFFALCSVFASKKRDMPGKNMFLCGFQHDFSDTSSVFQSTFWAGYRKIGRKKSGSEIEEM